MVYLFSGLAFRSYWCQSCGRVVDVFECCGHVHEIQNGEGSASYLCHGCGKRRSNGNPGVFPNSIGEHDLREIAVARVKREATGATGPRRGASRTAPPPEPGPFSQPLSPPSVAHSETSRETARSLAPETTAKAREAVREFLEKRGPFGATDEDMQRSLPMEANTQRPRRVELVAEGFVVDSGRRRSTTAGRSAVVWVLTRYAVERVEVAAP
jgi:hypothetical protein